MEVECAKLDIVTTGSVPPTLRMAKEKTVQQTADKNNS